MNSAAARKETVVTRSILALCLWLGAPSLAHSASRQAIGTWTAYVSEKHPSDLQLSMNLDGNGNIGARFDRAVFSGLTAEQIGSATRVPVEFEMRREAGTITFEGTFREGRGAGDLSFEPDREFPKKLRALGLDVRIGNKDDEYDLLNLAIWDVSIDFIRSMRGIGYRVPFDKYVSFRIFKVDPDYVRQMAALGFDHLSADKLVETRIHGATPEYIREMRAAGEDLALDEYIQSRIFQVTPEFKAEMSRLGFHDLDRDRLTQFRIHGVSADFIREIRKLGYSRVTADQLVAMRIHGVTPEFIRRVADAGYHKVPVEKLVEMRIFDIKPEMVKALDEDER
jgi:hypothetical protein